MGKFLIIDKISMREGQYLTTINIRLNSLKGERGHNMLFGGKNIIFMGNFMQPPTISGNETYMLQFWALNAAIVLTEQMRSEMSFGHSLTALCVLCYVVTHIFEQVS